jgi:hypothetical protein
MGAGAAAMYGWLGNVFVTNKELYTLLQEQEARRKSETDAQHAQNLGNFGQVFTRLGAIEQRQSNIEGKLEIMAPK